MYIPRSMLILIVVLYLLFLLSIDWIIQAGGAWYRPHLAALAALAVVALTVRESDSDEF
ncbi:MAG: hypothetical protein OXH27_01405 [Gammaproteobacteria bacterium]|nr:hypothetical protein [Gammaproteobacteria bacterium]MDE0479274.1 hypothetical protein [Gammaproteobacteria bacterium]MDE0507795.1 hypothetical protein [Gammaproteobacteria bacterium]